MSGRNVFPKEKAGYEKLYPVFSFRSYRETKYFSASDASDKKELHGFLSRMAGMSGLTWGEIKRSGNYHFHEIDSDKNINGRLRIPDGIALIQLKLSGDRESRIVGYFDNQNVFNVVAYDYNHRIYPMK